MFAVFESFNGGALLLLIIMFVVGTRQCCKWLKGSATARSYAKKGAMGILSHLFKK